MGAIGASRGSTSFDWLSIAPDWTSPVATPDRPPSCHAQSRRSFVTGVSESSRGWATTDPVAEKRADTILNLMLFIELFTLNRLWNGLTDEEMHWEPHAGAWGVRRRSECTTPTPMGTGEWVID